MTAVFILVGALVGSLLTRWFFNNLIEEGKKSIRKKMFDTSGGKE